MADITIPDFRFTGLYYPELVTDLRRWRRLFVPEIDDENDEEPFVQILSAIALMGHHNNVLLDHVALERFLTTARTREAVKQLLRPIGYLLKEASPAIADLVIALPSPLTVATLLAGPVPFETEPLNGSSIRFEALDDFDLDPTDVLDQAWQKDASADSLVDLTAALNESAAVTTLWTPGAPQAQDTLYFGSRSCLFDRVDLEFQDASSFGDVWTDDDDFVFEVYDGQTTQENPDVVADQGGGISRLRLLTLLGEDQRTGAVVRVTSGLTTQIVDLISFWDGTYNAVDLTRASIGLGAFDSDVTKLLVGSKWREPENVVVTTVGTVKQVTFDLPETTTRRWEKIVLGTIVSAAVVPANWPVGDSGFWMRWRLIKNGTVAPIVREIRIHEGTQYLKTSVTQGQSVSDDPVGNSDGTADQEFFTTRDGVIEGSVVVRIDPGTGDQTWTAVSDFLSSGPLDRHYRLDFDPDGQAFVRFGDGTSGKIPEFAATIAFDYRVGADVNGNVGAREIDVVRSGSSLLSSCFNPRAASGWAAQEGSTPESLEEAKDAGPATLTTLGRAVTARDYEALALVYTDVTGSKIVARAKAVEGGFGPKTVKLVVVENGLTTLSSGVLAALDEYFDGNEEADVAGVGIVNTGTTSVQATKVPIAVVATVTGTATEDELLEALRAYLTPLAKKTSGDWRWDFDTGIDHYAIAAILYSVDGVDDIDNLTLNGGGGDVAPIGSTSLPTLDEGATVLTIVAP